MSSETHLAVGIQHRIGNIALDARFETSAPWTIIFGASGSGKSTLLRLIAGLVRPDYGSISINGQIVCDIARKFFVAPHSRRVRWSAQHPALFQHMTVADNVAFALAQSRFSPPARAHDQLAECLEHFHLGPLAARRPAQLSGGEQQRVALARAAVGVRGSLLLLDEPFTGLDATVRGRLITDLKAWLGATPVLSVTHSVEDALLLDAEIIRLQDGKIAAQGQAADVLRPEIAGLQALCDSGRRG